MRIQILLNKLKDSGMTDYEIGKSICVPQSTVNRLRNGIHKSTSYERYEAVVKLAKEKEIIQ